MTSRRRGHVLLAAVLALGTCQLVAVAQAGAAPAPQAAQRPARHVFSTAAASFRGAVTPEQRATRLEAAAAGLPRLTQVYNVPALWNNGITGAGSTVAAIDSYGDPDIKKVIDTYDQAHNLPPADISILAPAGAVPGCTDQGVDTATCESWRGETDLDVLMIHIMAPAAHIIIAATPVAETEGFTGLPEMMYAIDYLREHKLADVISMSLGATEETFPSFGSIKVLDPALTRANNAGITIVTSTGDQGATSPVLTGDGLYPYRVVQWPASDPRVTAVGGTVLHLDANYHRTSPDTLWPDSGGGLSKAYARPSWQNGVAKITGSSMRSLPDLTMEGISGTSESAPLFAGVLALAVQLHHGPLGQINPALYRMGPRGTEAGIVDVTTGDNSYGGVTGYTASKGFDVVSGWGTIDAARFVPALVDTLRH
ncbi:S8 family serine peptidase [Solihabitans fulvus]|uniref:S8 family serine peptidase n=1 Tax=Solihabitans fulvus TaxID=1892852 RepID=A0A5B2XJL4_9PSEU|nr:S53 family peptidase [Solihabitans fulvus]KAA2264037.1 S8 family serine peptidase [Solihabitans fulvus]